LQNRQEILPTHMQNKRGTNQRYFVRNYFVSHLFCADASIYFHSPPFGDGGNKIMLILFFIILFNTFAFAQQFQLSEKAKNQIEKNIVNSSDWQKLQELKYLKDNFYNSWQGKSPYDDEINQIYVLYSYSLVELEYIKELEQINIALQNQKVMQQLNQKPKPTQEDIAELQKQQLQGKAPEQNNQQRIQKEMFDLLQEIRQDEAKYAQNNYYQSEEFLKDIPNYNKAKDLIKSMLEGKIPLSVKDAYYYMEAAYGKLHLTYDEYNTIIKNNIGFIKQWLTENKYNINDKEALHYGIQKFLSDTIYCTINGKKQGHVPYYYDYIDFKAKDDRRNYFVTKTLATGGGQCHTLPVLYLIFAEALNIDAFIAYNPQHSFIQFINNAGTTINYETTVDRFLSDAFYLETLPVMAKTQKNNIYINSLDRQHIVASCLYILASNFVEEHSLADKSFIKECIQIAQPYFPNQEYICIEHCNLQKILYADKFNTMVKLYKLHSMNQIEQFPEVATAYNNYVGYMTRISELGIQDIPKSEELRMMEHVDTKKKLQIAKNINTKTKKSLFINQ